MTVYEQELRKLFEHNVFPDELNQLAIKLIGIFGNEFFLFVLLRNSLAHWRCQFVFFISF